jgi:hypothetical protein
MEVLDAVVKSEAVCRLLIKVAVGNNIGANAGSGVEVACMN